MNAKFEGEGPVSFSFANFGQNLSCQNAVFEGAVNFGLLKCGSVGTFDGASFRSVEGANFAQAYFGSNFQCTGATFEGPANFNTLRCGRARFLMRAVFNGDVDMNYASFNDVLDCTSSSFAGAALFGYVECAVFGCEDATFKGYTVFHGFSVRLSRPWIGPASLEKKLISVTLRSQGFTFQKESLDLQRFVFNGFRGENDTAMAFVRAQNPAEFSREPYLQLEKHYTNVGNEVEAKKVHYQGRRDLRENARREGGVTKWPPWTKLGDILLNYLTGYGVQTWLLSIYIVLFLLLGMGVFWQDGTVSPRASASSGRDIALGTNEGKSASSSLIQERPAEEREAKESQAELKWQQPLSPLAYSLDLFLPLVNLRYDERWEPVGQWRAFYALVHAMVGWLLVPLLVASLTGIIRWQ